MARGIGAGAGCLALVLRLLLRVLALPLPVSVFAGADLAALGFAAFGFAAFGLAAFGLVSATLALLPVALAAFADPGPGRLAAVGLAVDPAVVLATFRGMANEQRRQNGLRNRRQSNFCFVVVWSTDPGLVT